MTCCELKETSRRLALKALGGREALPKSFHLLDELGGSFSGVVQVGSRYDDIC